MFKRLLCGAGSWLPAALLLAACGAASGPAPSPTVALPPTATLPVDEEPTPLVGPEETSVLAPTLPAVDQATEVAGSGAACPALGASLSLPSPLIAEQHLLKTAPQAPDLCLMPAVFGGCSYFEVTDGDTEQILTRNQAYRDSTGLEVALANAHLAPYGYRIEPAGCGAKGNLEHRLYQGDQVRLDGLYHLSLLPANIAGMAQVELGSPAGVLSVPEQGSSSAGRTGVTVAVTDTVQVFLDGRLVYEVPTPWSGVDSPITSESPRSWDDHWGIKVVEDVGVEVSQVRGRVVLDGQGLNQACGYEQTLTLAVINGQPFYLFEREGTIGDDATAVRKRAEGLALRPSR